MHIDIVDDLNMIIYLQNDRIKNIDFSDKSDLQDYFKSFLYPLIATIAMILISEVTKWYLKGIIGDFIGILVCVLVYLAVVYVVARKQLLNIIQTIKKEKV